MATLERPEIVGLKESLKDMRTIGSVTTKGKALQGFEPGSRKTAWYLHKVDRKAAFDLLSRVPPSVRTTFLDGFEASRRRAMPSLRNPERDLPWDVVLAYSEFDVGKDRRLTLVEWVGGNKPDFVFVPDRVLLARARGGRQVGRRGTSDPFGVRARMKARRETSTTRYPQGGMGLTGAISNRFGFLKATAARKARRTERTRGGIVGRRSLFSGRSAVSAGNARGAAAFLQRQKARAGGVSKRKGAAPVRYVGRSAGNAAGALAFLQRRSEAGGVASRAASTVQYAGQSTGNRSAARAFLERRAALGAR